MDRRTFSKLAGIAALGALAEGPQASAQISDGPDDPMPGAEVVLEDADLVVAFDSASGALLRMVRKTSSWVVERRPELGVSFRLLVPLRQRRDNFVLGTKQRAGRVDKVSEN